MMATVADAVLARRSVRAFLDRPVDRAHGGGVARGRRPRALGRQFAALACRRPGRRGAGECSRRRVRASLAADPVGRRNPVPGLSARARRAVAEPPLRFGRAALRCARHRARGPGRAPRPVRAAITTCSARRLACSSRSRRASGRRNGRISACSCKISCCSPRKRGLATCAQEAWALVHSTVGETLGLPEDRLFYCGMALGFADEAHPINAWRTDRVPLESFATFAGF